MKNFTLPHQHGEKHTENIHNELSRLDKFSATALFFKQMGDATRLRIFWLLCHREECVINIAALVHTSCPTVSHHLHSIQELGLLTSRRDGKEVYYKAADTEANRLLHLMTEELMEIACPEKSVDYHGSIEDVIYNIHQYLTEHISERITIEELSRNFLINPTTLKQAFKNIYGNSIATHIKEHRMERAAQLLKESNRTIAEIAQSVGYESQSRFTTAFKDAYGILPKEYRKIQVKKAVCK